MAYNSNQTIPTYLSVHKNNASKNVDTATVLPGISLVKKDDFEIINHSSTPLNVKPEIIHHQNNKSVTNGQNSNIDQSKSGDSDELMKFINEVVQSYVTPESSTNNNFGLGSKEEIAKHSLTSYKDINNLNVANNIQRFPCDICKKEFKMKSHLVCHRKNHSDERPFTCDVCLKSFKRKAHLKRHRLIHPSLLECYKCDICPKGFFLQEGLDKHRKAAHQPKDPYKCNVCSKSVKSKEHLKRHALIHTDRPMFGCDFCLKNFCRKDNLYKHRRNVHNVFESHVCRTCAKSFIVKQNYDNHMATHNTKTPLPPVNHILCKIRSFQLS